jgi:hypothetical protein
MSEVERFLADLQQPFASNADKDEAKALAHRTLAAFIGRQLFEAMNMRRWETFMVF